MEQIIYKTLQELLDSGYAYPLSFSLIEDFTELFNLKYSDRFIGFKDEEKFKRKLNLYANLYIDKYAKMLDRIKKLTPYYLNTDKVITKTANEENQSTNTQTETTTNSTQTIIGEQTTKNYELPVDNIENQTPTGRSTTDSQNNTSTLETNSSNNLNGTNNKTNNETITEQGFSDSEFIQLWNFVHEEEKNLVEELLKKFEPLFLGVKIYV